MVKLRNLHSDVWVGTVVFLIATLLFSVTQDGFETWIIPKISIVGIGLFGLGIALTSLISKQRQVEEGGEIEEEKKEDKPREIWSIKGLLSVVLIILYVQLIQWIGFLLASFFVLFAMLLLNGVRIWRAIALSAVTNILFIVVFTHLIYLPLPLGAGIFRPISIFLMYFTWG